MIRVTTSAGKKALATSLAIHAPVVLDHLAQLGKAFGPAEALEIELDDPETNAAVADEMSAARAAHVAVADEMSAARAAHVARVRGQAVEKKKAASREIAAMREILAN